MDNGSIRTYLVRPGESGQILPLVALSLVVLLGAAALAVDVGYWRYQQRIEQIAADSAAIAGANEMIFSTQSADIIRAAKNDAAANGFTDGVANTTVAVTPPAGQYNPTQYPSGAVEVFVTKVQPVFFGAIFGIGNQPVRARAVASLTSSNGGCIYVMKGSISGNLTLNGGGQGGINTSPLCGIVVNGNLNVNGQANVDASSISYAGSGPSGGSYPHGQPVKSVAGSDPCIRFPGCAYLANLKTTNNALFSAACQDSLGPGGAGILPPMPLPPGRYCYGSVNNKGVVTGYTNSPVTLQPGLFIMDKGMFAGAAVSGTDVTIYNNCTVTTPGQCDTTLNGGNVNNSIVAPKTTPPNGDYAALGMAYYQPPSLVNTVTVNGAAGAVTAMGGVYAPNADFVFNGQLPTLSLLVAGTITMNGGGLTAGGTGSYGGLTNATLSE